MTGPQGMGVLMPNIMVPSSEGGLGGDIIEYIANSLGAGTVGTAVNVDFTAPASRAVGDLLIFHMTDEDGSSLRSPPIGYKPVTNSAISTEVLQQVFTRRADGTSADTASFLCTGNYIGRISAWRNVSDLVPLVSGYVDPYLNDQGLVTTTDTDGGNTCAGASQVAKNNACVVLDIISTSSAVTSTDSIGRELIYESTFSATISSSMYAEQIGTDVGTVPANSFTFSASPTRIVTTTLLLRPLVAERPVLIIGTHTNNGTNNTTFTVPTIEDGDELFLAVRVPQGTLGLSNTHWSQVHSQVSGSAIFRIYKYYRPGLASDSGITVITTGTTRACGFIFAIRGGYDYWFEKAQVSDGDVSITIPPFVDNPVSVLSILGSRTQGSTPIELYYTDGHYGACQGLTATGTIESSIQSFLSDVNSGDIGIVTAKDNGTAASTLHMLKVFAVGGIILTEAGAPTCSISKATGDPQEGGSVVYNVTFSENVDGFTEDNVRISGGSWIGAIAVAGSGSSYTITFSPNMVGDYTVEIPAGAGVSSATAKRSEAATPDTFHWSFANQPALMVAANAGSTLTGFFNFEAGQTYVIGIFTTRTATPDVAVPTLSGAGATWSQFATHITGSGTSANRRWTLFTGTPPANVCEQLTISYSNNPAVVGACILEVPGVTGLVQSAMLNATATVNTLIEPITLAVAADSSNRFGAMCYWNQAPTGGRFELAADTGGDANWTTVDLQTNIGVGWLNASPSDRTPGAIRTGGTASTLWMLGFEMAIP